MSCGCSENSKFNNNKKLSGANGSNNKILSLNSMSSMSIDEIVNLYKNGYLLEDQKDNYSNIINLYRDGYMLDGLENPYSSVAYGQSYTLEERYIENGEFINSLTYLTDCTGTSTLDKSSTSPIGLGDGFDTTEAWASSFIPTSRCLDSITLKLQRIQNISLTVEIMRDSGGFPIGYPQTGSSLALSDIYYTSIPTTESEVNIPIGIVLPDATSRYWIVVTSHIYDPSLTPDYIMRTKAAATTNGGGAWRNGNMGWITTTSGLYFKTFKLNYALPLATITLTAPLPSINIGMTEAISAVCKDTTNTTMTCPTLIWATSTGAVTFDSPGIIRGASAGTTTIKATSGSIFGEVVVTVNANPAIITIQSVTVGGIPCTSVCSVVCTPTCPKIVNVVVVWSNSGGSNGTFTPKITVTGGIPITGTPLTTTIIPGEIGKTTTFTEISLPQGSPQICIDIGTIT